MYTLKQLQDEAKLKADAPDVVDLEEEVSMLYLEQALALLEKAYVYVEVAHTPVQTQGHLKNNGGLRGHSVGEFFPFITMAQGTYDNMRWWVLNPQGQKVGQSWNSAVEAEQAAIAAHAAWSRGV